MAATFVNKLGKFTANPRPELIQPGAGLKRAKTKVPTILKSAPSITKILPKAKFYHQKKFFFYSFL